MRYTPWIYHPGKTSTAQIWSNSKFDVFFLKMVTLPETNSLSLKIGFPKSKVIF